MRVFTPLRTLVFLQPHILQSQTIKKFVSRNPGEVAQAKTQMDMDGEGGS